MTVREAFLWGREHLAASGSSEAAIEADLLLRHALGWDRAGMYLRWEAPLEDAVWDRYRLLLDERAGGRPVHYILGEREFMGLRFAVDERVLIPRPETEILTEVVINFLQTRRDGPRTPNPEPGQVVVDVGTGSGCIAVALAHVVPDVSIIATDISARALDVAAANARRHGVEDRVEFRQGDLLAPLPPELAGKVDVVVSNPPYVSPQQAPHLPREVREYEPPVAVFGHGDGLDDHRRLITASARWLTPGGLLALEVGMGQAATVRDFLASQPGYADIRTLRDHAGIDRVLAAVQRDARDV